MIHFSIKRLLGEPLFHFLIIGFLLFLLYDFKQGQLDDTPDRIVVSENMIEQLSAQFKLTKLRPPTAKEQAALIENHIRDEVYYREAIAMGLDQNDTQVRKRMRMKLEYFLEELPDDTISDEALTSYLENNPDKFQADPQFSFQQIYINPDKHQDAQAVAQALLLRVANGEDPDVLGDATLLQPYFSQASGRIIDNHFGEGVADQLARLSINNWTGPVISSYGLHLVKVSEHIASYLPPLAEIRKVLEREYTAQRRLEQKDQAYQAMRERYQIVIESSVKATAAIGKVSAE